MLKRLFGIKKVAKPEILDDAKTILFEKINEESLSKNLESSLNDCLDLLDNASEEDKKQFSLDVFELVTSLPLAQSVVALSVSATLMERGYTNASIVDRMVDLYQNNLTLSLPFYEELDKRVKIGEEGDADVDIDVDSLYRELIGDRTLMPVEIAKAVASTEHYAQSLINMLSINRNYVEMAKERLKQDIETVRDYNQGAYWISRLFEVLFDEPIVVIDVDNHVGFEGKMSGVCDNYQMQFLLMGMEALAQPTISEHDLSVVNGTGIHISNSTVVSKWNMYNKEICDQENWEDIKIGPDMTMELKDFWIWGEGTPTEISVHNGKRVVLLGRSSYKRQTRIQRTFKNIKASIVVDKILTDEEINALLGLKS